MFYLVTFGNADARTVGLGLGFWGGAVLRVLM